MLGFTVMLAFFRLALDVAWLHVKQDINVSKRVNYSTDINVLVSKHFFFRVNLNAIYS